MEGRATRIMVIAALVLVLLTTIGYVALILGQSDRSDVVTVGFVTIYMLLMASMLAITLRSGARPVTLRMLLRGGAAGGLLVLGVLGAFSIGLPLIAAGALATGAAVRTVPRPRWTPAAITGVVAAGVAVAVLVAGFEVSGRLIVCPARGVSGGSGYLLVSGGYHWTCVDGQLNFASGFCSSSGGGIDANGHAFAASNC
jgi:hypothetical protein